MYNVLICDDEQDIVNALKIYLSAPDITLFEAHTGREALAVLGQADIHLILLDIMMPELDGISAMVKIRESSNVPVILLTAKSEDSDKVYGLNCGADDYVTKPFNPVEVKARVRSQLRRYITLGGGSIKSGEIKIGGITIDDEFKTVSVDGASISLTPIEYQILKFLMENCGKVYCPKDIYKHVWGEEPYGAENAVAVHIRHIREKIEINPQDPHYIKAIWGKGYKMEDIRS